MTQESLALPQYRSFPITLFSQFEVSVGQIDLPVDHTLFTHPVVYWIHVCFSLISNVLLFNLLVAMMSDTQWRVTQERDELWRTQVNSLASSVPEQWFWKFIRLKIVFSVHRWWPQLWCLKKSYHSACGQDWGSVVWCLALENAGISGRNTVNHYISTMHNHYKNVF